MVASAQKFPEASVGSSVTVKIPEVDRNKGDPKNIIAVVLDVTPDGMYRLGTESGVLAHLYTKNQFQICPTTFANVEDVPQNTLSLRATANAKSKGSGQGFTRCNCKTKCVRGNCGCKRKGLLCNSKCHGSLPCTNK